MQSMLRIFALGIVLLMFLPVVGIAQPQDHLKCYMVKDPMKVNADVFLDSSQFDIQEDCKIIGKERFFCGGVDKMVEPPSGFPIFPDAPDRICYRIECPPGQGQKPVPEDVEVEDQFGKRTLTKFNPHYLCTPAFKTVQPCPERAVCGGECTDLESDEVGICRQLAGSLDCLCLPIQQDCNEPDACEPGCDASIGECQEDPAGTGECECRLVCCDPDTNPLCSIGQPCDGTDPDFCDDGILRCDPITGANSCDDPNPSPEICFDNADNNCDGVVDEFPCQTQ